MMMGVDVVETDRSRGTMNNNEQWLKYARKVGFRDAQYEEAIKKIGIPASANQLLDALLSIGQNRTSPIEEDQGKSAKPTTYGAIDEDKTTASLIKSVPPSSELDNQSKVLQTDNLRRSIFIDGPNVARTHGKEAAFSWLGIKICTDWFLAKKHKVKVFVPSERCQFAEPSIIDHLIHHDTLIKTPTGCNDDLFVIEAAMQTNAIIVSNDLFRDESRFNSDVRCFVDSHRLPYIFVDDLFIPAKDPLGKMGPNLDDFLKETYQHDSFHNKLNRTKSHQRYNQRATNGPPMRQHRKLQASHSLPN